METTKIIVFIIIKIMVIMIDKGIMDLEEIIVCRTKMDIDKMVDLEDKTEITLEEIIVLKMGIIKTEMVAIVITKMVMEEDHLMKKGIEKNIKNIMTDVVEKKL